MIAHPTMSAIHGLILHDYVVHFLVQNILYIGNNIESAKKSMQLSP